MCASNVRPVSGRTFGPMNGRQPLVALMLAVSTTPSANTVYARTFLHPFMRTILLAPELSSG